MKNFKGIFSALVTPFDENEDINEKALKDIVEFNMKLGVKGFYVCGSTGESFLMNEEERKTAMRVVREAAPDATLIAQIGSLNEREAASLGEYANELGYDAVSSVAPFYFKFTFDEIKNYYFRLADRSGLPMLVYNVPHFSGVALSVSQLGELINDPRMLGVKHTSQDYFMLEQCKTAYPDKIIYNGYDEMCLGGLAMGADGAIGSTYNFMGDKFIKIYDLFNEGKTAEAYEIQKEANKLISVLVKVGVIPTVKEILNQLGLNAGDCRKPFGKLTEEDKKIIKAEITDKL